MRTCEHLRAAVHAVHLRITIDGPAGAGKSTVGRGLAETLSCRYLDTGLMYRAVTRRALLAGIDPAHGDELTALARSMRFTLEDRPAHALLVDGAVAGEEMRTSEVDAAVSEVSAHAGVRAVLVERQRAFAEDGCIVMVGRDIGTVVLPRAPVKLWVTASAAERARRRAQEQPHAAEATAGARVQESLRARDRHDSSRTLSPLAQPADAIVIDTEALSQEQALERALAAVERGVDRV